MWRLLVLLLSPLIIAASAITFSLVSSDGLHYSSLELAHSRASVLVFLATDCPISKRYSPVLHRLESDYEPKGVAFYAVFSDPALPSRDARDYLTAYSLRMPGLMDPANSLARQTGARVTPEAVVLSAAGALLYRGRIDDQYVDWGKTRPQAVHQDLREALDSVLADHPVQHPTTKALGCSITNALP